MGFWVEIKVFSIDPWIPRAWKSSVLPHVDIAPSSELGEGKKVGGVSDMVEQASTSSWVVQSWITETCPKCASFFFPLPFLSFFLPFALCLSGLYFVWDACLALSFREKKIWLWPYNLIKFLFLGSNLASCYFSCLLMSQRWKAGEPSAEELHLGSDKGRDRGALAFKPEAFPPEAALGLVGDFRVWRCFSLRVSGNSVFPKYGVSCVELQHALS